MGTTVPSAGDGEAPPARGAYLNSVLGSGILHLGSADPWDSYFCSLQGIFLGFKNTKLQPGQRCPQWQGTWGKLEDGGKCPRGETPSCSLPRASHQSPRLDPGGTPHCTLRPRIPDPRRVPAGCHGEHRRGTGRTSTARERRHGIRGHRAPGQGRAAGRKWGLPASAKYRKETDAGSALWSCQERELKVRPRSQLRSGVAGAERSCCVSALQTPSNSSHRSAFARHSFYYLCLREEACRWSRCCPCRRAPPAPFAVILPPAAFAAHLSACFSCFHVRAAVGKPGGLAWHSGRSHPPFPADLASALSPAGKGGGGTGMTVVAQR
ncbi:uncharacterized protein LOC142090168 [Calonectris borealis]|uniref:uncharacterized protein LOC142090168 n=1 Tax=Calonectris borealis TaxID=1323832 RepID=UPI003F4B9D84